MLPLRPREKMPSIDDWLNRASADTTQLDAWFPPESKANIGILTGTISGLLVVDVDVAKGGSVGVEALQDAYGRLPATMRVNTGGGGYHLYYRLRDGVGKTRDRIRVEGFEGVDLKCNGQVVAPPSIHPSGQPYEFDAGWSPETIVEAPSWLVDLVSKPSTSKTTAPSAGSDIPEGGRNDGLFRLASRMRGQGYEPDVIRAALLSYNSAHCNPPLSEAEVISIADGVQRYPLGDGQPISDLGNARRVVALADGDYRYEHAMKQWFVWSGTHWKVDSDGAILRLAKQVVDQLLATAQNIEDVDSRKRFEAFARKSQQVARINAMVELARTEPGMSVELAHFDSRHYLLNVQNGTVDLRSHKLLAHRREDMLTQIIDVDFAADAQAPVFSAFVSSIFSGDRELIEYVQDVAGYCATGETKEQCFFVLYGATANGKSSLLNALRGTLGGYAKHTPTETLMAKASGAPSNDLARLIGVRLATASEANADQRMAEALIKQVTGDEPVVARKLYQDFVEFRPTFKILMATNHLPQISGNDPAIWRRVRTIPFERTFLPHEQDHALGDKLVAERAGILRWIVDGAARWYERGLKTPTAVEHANDNYRSTMDTVGQFVDEACERGGAGTISSSALYASYRGFTVHRGEVPVSPVAFGRALTTMGVPSVKIGGIKHRRGLAFRLAA